MRDRIKSSHQESAVKRLPTLTFDGIMSSSALGSVRAPAGFAFDLDIGIGVGVVVVCTRCGKIVGI